MVGPSLIDEFIFWSIFLLLNFAHYLINYLFYFEKSSFLPYLSDIRKSSKLRVVSSTNMDFFRYTVEFSILVLFSRIFPLGQVSVWIAALFLLLWIFNQYQFIIRRIYETEPILFNDLKLLKNGLAIVWQESRWKILGILCVFVVSFFVLEKGFEWYLTKNQQIGISTSFWVISMLWLMPVIYTLFRVKGFYVKYPNDIYLRNHFTVVELLENIKRSFQHYRISRMKIGHLYREKRKPIAIKLKGSAPNIHFLFIESYGSYYYKEPSIQHSAYNEWDLFQKTISKAGFSSVSNFSKSTTTGGQSWLTYSSVLFGYRLDNNTLFENLLFDKDFRSSNSLLQLLKNCGYYNYNLNPINPINGINVPYDAMREFYSIDRWLLSKDIQYTGDQYGFGACAPDQYSMNFTMDLMRKEAREPYSFFYLTKNSHSPYIPPVLVDDWKSLNHSNGNTHIHKGFLKYPETDDYKKAIQYQLHNLSRFISDHGRDNDLFIVIGDHQPPILSDPKQHGLETPVHVISRDGHFLNHFKDYGFNLDISAVNSFIRHEGFYSLFLQAFANAYAYSAENIPEYEPEGIKL